MNSHPCRYQLQLEMRMAVALDRALSTLPTKVCVGIRIRVSSRGHAMSATPILQGGRKARVGATERSRHLRLATLLILLWADKTRASVYDGVVMSNLWLALMDRMGVRVDRFGD